MNFAIVTEAYPPMRSSGAVLMRDLCAHLAERGHTVTAIVPDDSVRSNLSVAMDSGVRVVRVKAPQTRDRTYAVRLAAEALTPYVIRRRLRNSDIAISSFDAIIWYSPTIFFGPLVKWLKGKSNAPGYLILRDIFPEWAADLGLIRRGAIYRALQAVARYQYDVADIIGVQTAGNLSFFADDIERGKPVEVLQNWSRPGSSTGCSIDLAKTHLQGRTIFGYTGNMGVAQGMDKILDLAVALRNEERAGFLFVGRGSELDRLKGRAKKHDLTNCLFFDEIGIDEMPGLFEQVHVGLVSLDFRHRWHNIPGKFISYTHAGLAILATVNPDNDMIDLIRDAEIGYVSTDPEGSDLPDLAMRLIANNSELFERASRSRLLAQELFSVEAVADQLESSLAAHSG